MHAAWSVLFTLMISLYSASAACAAGWSGETEAGGAEKSPTFASQYVFYDAPHVNALARYFYVNDVLERGEFAVGPTFNIKGVTTKLQFGLTTNRDALFALTAIGSISGHTIIYIADAKVSTGERPSTFYEKLFVAITPGGTLQLRIEDFLVEKKNGFLRLGVEYRVSVTKSTHFFVAPFYDPDNHEWGGQAGIRFFDW